MQYCIQKNVIIDSNTANFKSALKIVIAKVAYNIDSVNSNFLLQWVIQKLHYCIWRLKTEQVHSNHANYKNAKKGNWNSTEKVINYRLCRQNKSLYKIVLYAIMHTKVALLHMKIENWIGAFKSCQL